MRTTSTLSVLFWIHNSRANKNNLSQVYARLTINGKRVTMGLNQKVDIGSCDSKQQKVKRSGRTALDVDKTHKTPGEYPGFCN